MTDEGQTIAGVPIDEAIKEVEEKIAYSNLFQERPEEAWIKTLETFEHMMELFTSEVPPNRLPELAVQVVSLETVITTFRAEAMNILLMKKAERMGIPYGQLIMLLEEEAKKQSQSNDEGNESRGNVEQQEAEAARSRGKHRKRGDSGSSGAASV